MAAGLGLAGCSSSAGSGGGPGGGPADGGGRQPVQLAAVRLAAFHDCAALLSGLRRATAEQVGPYGLGTFGYGPGVAGPMAGGAPGDAVAAREAAPGGGAAPGQDHSTTNVQEAGVDEPDLVKTDGRHIVAVARGRLYVVDAAAHRVTGSLTLPGPPGAVDDDLLLSGDRVLVVERGGMTMPLPFRGGDGESPRPAGSRLTLVDISSAPRVVSTLTADGFYVDARQVGAVARVVVRSAPHINFPLPQPRSRPQSRTGAPPASSESSAAPATPAERTRANQEIVRRAPLADWLPTFEVTRGGGTETQRVPCGQVSHPPTYAGTSLLSVLTVDLNGDLGATMPVSVVGGGQAVYASAKALYVTDRTWRGAGAAGDVPAPAPAGRTDIYKFDISGTGRPRYVASGAVAGDVLNQYSLSEYGGNLRVATTTFPVAPRPRPLPPAPGRAAATPATPNTTSGSATSQSSVYVLGQRGDRLAAIGELDGLGAGERIYAVRFLGPTGYVVTFRQTDPLHVLDLRDPRAPRQAGQLKINGYSSYLHPAGNGLLIGVGQDATAEGRTTGTQVSLFDVRDPADPRRLSTYTVASGSSEVEFDPHAFLYRPDTGLTVLPVQQVGIVAPDAVRAGQALVLSVRDHEVREVGTVGQPRAENQPAPYTTIRRSLTIGTTLWTLSDVGLQASDAATLSQRAWVPFA